MSDRLLRILCIGIVSVMIGIFCFNKLYDEVVVERAIEELIEKLRSIVRNNGAWDIRFEKVVYDLGPRYTLAQTMFDICSGLAVGFVFSIVELLKQVRGARLKSISATEPAL